MLSMKKVFCFVLIHYYVTGKFISSQLPNYYVTKAPQKITSAILATPPPDVRCDPDKSYNSKNDIKVMIDQLYNEKSLDKIIKQNYQSKAENIRDKNLQNLNQFTDWFENQPGHLKQVLQRSEKLRKVQVEPIVEIVARVLSEAPKLEMLYDEKNNRTIELVKQLNKYIMICKLNCEDEEPNDNDISKRDTGDDFYCSSLEDLHKYITKKLDEFVITINNITDNELSSSDKMYQEKIEKIKSSLKDKALNEFGRTMYEIKSFALQIDTKLLEMEQAVEQYGKYCKSCGPKSLVRKIREANPESHGKQITGKPNLVDRLLENKFKEIVESVQSDCKNIFNDLNMLIQKTEEVSVEKWTSIQEELHAMTVAETDVMDHLQQRAPKISIDVIIKIIDKIVEVIKFIINIINIIKKIPK